jgi:hypothetical protein
VTGTSAADALSLNFTATVVAAGLNGDTLSFQPD